MIDLIDIISVLLTIFMVILAALHFMSREKFLSFIFVIISLWPILWAGLIRLPIPQTLIWMGMNILAIIFIWQGVSGFIFKRSDNNILHLPSRFSWVIKNVTALFIGLLFAVLILLTRI